MACRDCTQPKRLERCTVHPQAGARICKDCCITGYKGHTCAWWDLCWNR